MRRFFLSSIPLAALALAGCAEVSGALHDADAKLSAWAGTDQRSGAADDAPPPDAVSSGLAAWEEGDPAAAVASLRPEAEAGDADAQFLMGLARTTGRGLERDAEAGVAWFRKAAEQGQRDAAFMLGLAYERGRGVAGDGATARRWYEQAARAGHGGAHYRLALMDLRTDQTARGMAHLEDAAEAGHAEAQAALGEAYSTGTGVEAEDAWAVRWLGAAARQGIASARYRLGAHYVAGRGVAREPVRGLAWLRLATAQGHQGAEETARALAGRIGPVQSAEADALSRRLASEPPERAKVRFVQRALRRAGYTAGPIDGLMGPATVDALKAYQQDRALAVDGVAGPRTLASLRGESVI